MKKFLVGIATFITMAVICIISATAEAYGDFEYTVLDDGTIEINLYNGSSATVEIPSEIDGKAVSSIGYGAFENCGQLTSVIIPDSVTSIQSYAFSGCSALASVTLPENTTILNKRVFAGCTSLKSVSIPKLVTSIGYGAFEDCTSLSSVSLPDSVRAIYDYAFANCTALKSVSIPYAVRSIGFCAFGGCTALTSAGIPAGATDVDSRAFEGCTSLKSFSVPSSNKNYTSLSGVLYSKDKTILITYPEGKTDTSFTIPDSVTAVGDYAFSGCAALEMVIISENVTDVGEGAFTSCIKLKTVQLPDGMKEIKSYAFSDCYSLKKIAIPEGVTEIGSYAFANCSMLSAVTIPESVTEIGSYAFSRCTALDSLIIPDGVRAVRSYAFNGCISLASVTLPDSLAKIEANAFLNTNIMNYQSGDIKYLDGWVISCADTVTNAVIPDGTEGIADEAFSKCKKLSSVTLPDSLTHIGAKAFDNTPVIENQQSEIISIGGWVIYASRSITKAVIPEGIKGIADKAFYGCRALATVKLPDSIRYIGYEAFAHCPSLTFVAVPDNTESIADYSLGYYYSPIECENVILGGFAIECQRNSIAHRYAEANKIPCTLTACPLDIKSFRSPSKSNIAIRLSWKANQSAEGYIIEQYIDGEWVQIADITDNTTDTYKVTELKSGTAYRFRMTAYAGSGEEREFGATTEAITVNTAAASVMGLAVKSRSSTAIRLKWTKNSSVDGYIIEQYVGEEWVELADINDYTVTEYKVTELNTSTSYLFRMRAYAITEYGEITYGKYTEELTCSTASTVVSGLKVSSKSTTAIRLGWKENVTADGYVIEQYIDNSWVQIAQIESSETVTYKVTGLSKATTYQFRVKTYNETDTALLYSNYKNVSGTTL